jgi:hypothetical protein
MLPPRCNVGRPGFALRQVHELESQMGSVVPLKEEVGQLRTRLADQQDVKRIEGSRLREDCNELQVCQQPTGPQSLLRPHQIVQTAEPPHPL